MYTLFYYCIKNVRSIRVEYQCFVKVQRKPIFVFRNFQVCSQKFTQNYCEWDNSLNFWFENFKYCYHFSNISEDFLGVPLGAPSGVQIPFLRHYFNLNTSTGPHEFILYVDFGDRIKLWNQSIQVLFSKWRK